MLGSGVGVGGSRVQADSVDRNIILTELNSAKVSAVSSLLGKCCPKLWSLFIEMKVYVSRHNYYFNQFGRKLFFLKPELLEYRPVS